MTVAALILAAGFGRRMRGIDKLLQPVGSEPLLRRIVRQARAATDPVFVTVPGADHPRVDVIADLDVHSLDVPDAAEGMSASLRRGLSALPPDVQGLLVCPADMPDLSEDDFAIMINALQSKPDKIHQATDSANRPGHPVIFPRWSFDALRQVQGDTGGREVIKTHSDRRCFVPLPGTRATTDLDTPEAWDAWRRGRPLP